MQHNYFLSSSCSHMLISVQKEEWNVAENNTEAESEQAGGK